MRSNNFGRNHFAQNKARVSQSEVELLFNNFRGNFFARNEVRVSKMEGFFAGLAAATLSHEMKVECRKLRKKLRLTTARATLSRETKLECQSYGFFVSLDSPAATLLREARFECRSRFVRKGLCVKVFV